MFKFIILAIGILLFVYYIDMLLRILSEDDKKLSEKYKLKLALTPFFYWVKPIESYTEENLPKEELVAEKPKRKSKKQKQL